MPNVDNGTRPWITTHNVQFMIRQALSHLRQTIQNVTTHLRLPIVSVTWTMKNNIMLPGIVIVFLYDLLLHYFCPISFQVRIFHF